MKAAENQQNDKGTGHMRKKGCGCVVLVLAVIAIIDVIMALIVFLNIDSFMGVKLLFLDGPGGEQTIPYQEVNVSEDDLKGEYYYQQLSEDKQQIYQEILQGIKDHEEEIYVHSEDAGQANTVFQFVLKDKPEIFWCDGKVTSTTYSGETSYTVMEPEYLYDAETSSTMQTAIEAEAESCLAGISADATDYQKILYVYEYIINTVDYDLDASDNQNIYSVFVRKQSVCAGYARATQYLLDRLGVFCTYVTGTTDGGQRHAWNLVKCEGDYYYVDTTWGDPVFQASEGEDVTEQENITYDYMCCDDTELFKNHIPDDDAVFPECTSMEWNYYVVNGMYYMDYDADEILQKMNAVIASGDNPFVVKFANNALYEEAYDDIFDRLIPAAAQNLADQYGLSKVKYQYIDDSDLNKIMIYWQYQ
jgi:hypothetical protein